MRYLFHQALMGHEDARSAVTIRVPNWTYDSIVQYMNVLQATARGTPASPAWDRMPYSPVWSIKPVRNSKGQFKNTCWTYTTMAPIVEAAKLDSVSPVSESGVGVGSLVLKSGGKVISLVPPMTFKFTAKPIGDSFLQHVEVRCATVTIANTDGVTGLNFVETHAMDVSFENASVKTWKLLPPYDNYEKYIQKTLAPQIREARELTQGRDGVPKVPKRTYKLAKTWFKNGLPPGVAHHRFWMNPHLSKPMCGNVEHDQARLAREKREHNRRLQEDAKAAKRRRK